MSDQYATPPAAKGRLWFVAVLLFMVALAVAGGVALSRVQDADDRAAPGSVPGVPASSAPPAGVPSDVPSSAADDDPSSPVPVPGRTSPKSATTTHKVSGPASAPAAGPVIVAFEVKSQPTCPSGTDKVRYDGQPVVLEWKVTGADRTTLAVDGPGLYAEYGTTGATKVNFPCGGEPGSYQSHTYTLTAVDGETTRSKTLTVRARVQQIAAT